MLDANGDVINGNRHLEIQSAPALTLGQMLLACKALFFHEFCAVESTILSQRRSQLDPKKYGGEGCKTLRAKCDTIESLLKAACMFGAIRTHKVEEFTESKCVYLIVYPLSIMEATRAEKTRARKMNLWYLEEWSYPATPDDAQREAADEAARQILAKGGAQ